MSSKRLKTATQGSPSSAKQDGFLGGVKVFVPDKGIPFLTSKLKIWNWSVPKYSGGITQALHVNPLDPGITHVLVGDGGIPALPPQLQPPRSPPDQPNTTAIPAAASIPAPSTSKRGASRDAAPGSSGGLPAGGGSAAEPATAAVPPAGAPHVAASREAEALPQCPGTAASDAAAGVAGGMARSMDGASAPAPSLGSGAVSASAHSLPGLESPNIPTAPVTPKTEQLSSLAPLPPTGAGSKPAMPATVEQEGTRRPQPAPAGTAVPRTAPQPVERLPPQGAGSGAAEAGRGQKRRLQGAGGRRQPVFVEYTWLERCLAARQVLDVTEFPPLAPKAPSIGGRGDSRASTSSVETLSGEVSLETILRRRWLGEQLWRPECEHISLTRLALEGVYSEERSAALGNEGVVSALRELGKYERALAEDYLHDPRKGGDVVVNHRALRYAKAAAMVRGCSYRLERGVCAGQLPFVGEATARQINDIIATGTCDVLDSFRADQAVTDSRGRLRWGSERGRTRALFHSLPGAGQKTVKRWWDLGMRSFEDLEIASEPGGPLAPDGAFPLSSEQAFSLRHRDDLLEATSAEEVDEMRGVVQATLAAVSTPGWQVETVGGGARSSAVHDADLLVTHPSQSVEGVVGKLRDCLIHQGRLLPPEEAMCRVQSGLLPIHLERLKEEHLRESSAAPSHQTLDKFDHIYGMYRTLAGRVRRLDIIITPCDEFAFALVGWIGSRQYLRFMRQLAKDHGMFLNSHRLMRKVGAEVFLVPDEKPPLNAAGEEAWPPGWGPGRRVETQHDVFELLGIPYREPRERNCP